MLEKWEIVWSDHTILVINGFLFTFGCPWWGTQRVCGDDLSWLRKRRRESCSISTWSEFGSSFCTWLLEGACNSFWCCAIKEPQGERSSVFTPWALAGDFPGPAQGMASPAPGLRSWAADGSPDCELCLCLCGITALLSGHRNGENCAGMCWGWLCNLCWWLFPVKVNEGSLRIQVCLLTCHSSSALHANCCSLTK